MILFIVMNTCKENKIDRVDRDTPEISAEQRILTDTTSINNTLQGIWRENEYIDNNTLNLSDTIFHPKVITT